MGGVGGTDYANEVGGTLSSLFMKGSIPRGAVEAEPPGRILRGSACSGSEGRVGHLIATLQGAFLSFISGGTCTVINKQIPGVLVAKLCQASRVVMPSLQHS